MPQRSQLDQSQAGLEEAFRVRIIYDPGFGSLGSVGSAVVSVWAYGLLRDTGGILLDLTPASSDLPAEIRRALESDGDVLITDLHVWRIGAGRFAAIVSLVAHEPRPVESYRRRLRRHEELVHLTIEPSSAAITTSLPEAPDRAAQPTFGRSPRLRPNEARTPSTPPRRAAKTTTHTLPDAADARRHGPRRCALPKGPW